MDIDNKAALILHEFWEDSFLGKENNTMRAATYLTIIGTSVQGRGLSSRQFETLVEKIVWYISYDIPFTLVPNPIPHIKNISG